MDDVIPTLLEKLRQTQFQPREQLVEYQRGLLEPLVRHARVHVPFYRESGRLDALFRADDSIDWDRWGDIPLLTRTEVQRSEDRLRAEMIPPEHGAAASYSTSGSTAEPVRVWHTRLFNPLVRAAVTMRNIERNGIDPEATLAFLYPFAPSDFDIRRARMHDGSPDRLSEFGLTGERFDLADTRPARELIDEIVAIRPTLLRGQPVTLELLCAYDRERRLSELGIAAVFCTGEHFPEAAKRDVAEHLGAWIVEAYGSVECGRLAHSCPHCGRFHVEAETMLVEVIGEDGGAVPAGGTGWVVATPFYNFAMPLIRYDHADRAKVAGAGGCAITLPALDAVYGKERTVFVFPGGTAFRPSAPMSAIVRFLGAQSFQIAQVAEDRCEMRFVPGRLAPADMRFDEMTQLLRSIWWEGLQVDYRPVEAIPRRSARGKLAAYVREIEGDARIAGIRAGGTGRGPASSASP